MQDLIPVRPHNIPRLNRPRGDLICLNWGGGQLVLFFFPPKHPRNFCVYGGVPQNSLRATDLKWVKCNMGALRGGAHPWHLNEQHSSEGKGLGAMGNGGADASLEK